MVFRLEKDFSYSHFNISFEYVHCSGPGCVTAKLESRKDVVEAEGEMSAWRSRHVAKVPPPQAPETRSPSLTPVP